MTGTFITPPNNTASVRATRDWNSRLPSRFLSAIILVILLGLLLPEKVFEHLQLGEQECFTPDLITGLKHLKNKTITWKAEGYSRGSTNSLGFLDYEHNLAKAPGVLRIAMLGDSLTESLQVPQQSRFSNLLEQRLNESDPGKFEVFNFGVASFGTGQELLNFLRYAEPFKPDLTILFFDYGDQYKNLKSSLCIPWHPHVVFGVSGEKLTASWSDLDSWVHGCSAIPTVCFEQQRRTSRAWGIFLHLLHTILGQPATASVCDYLVHPMIQPPIQDILVSLLPVDRFGPFEFRRSPANIRAARSEFCSKFDIVYADPKDVPLKRFNRGDFQTLPAPQEFGAIMKTEHKRLQEQRREAWLVTLVILRRLSAECRGDGCKLVVVGMPVPSQCAQDHEYECTELKSIADGKQTFFVDLTSSFNQACKARRISPRIAYHYSIAGHQLMADLLLDFLKSKKILP